MMCGTEALSHAHAPSFFKVTRWCGGGALIDIRCAFTASRTPMLLFTRERPLITRRMRSVTRLVKANEENITRNREEPEQQLVLTSRTAPLDCHDKRET